MEHITHRNKISNLDQQRILTDVQHGFHKSWSCETQIFEAVNDLAKSLNKAQQVDSILLGFSKAFGHWKRLLKLQRYGIWSKNLKRIENVFKNWTQQEVAEVQYP